MDDIIVYRIIDEVITLCEPVRATIGSEYYMHGLQDQQQVHAYIHLYMYMGIIM